VSPRKEGALKVSLLEKTFLFIAHHRDETAMRKVCCVGNPRSNVSQRGIRITSSERYRVMSVHCMEQTPTSKEAIQKFS